MFGMVVAAGISMLADVDWDRRSMVIFAISISIGLGLQLEPGALQHLPGTAKVLLTSGLLPAAFLAIILNSCCRHRSPTRRPRSSPAAWPGIATIRTEELRGREPDAPVPAASWIASLRSL